MSMPNENKFSIYDHLDELRTRIIICALLLLASFIVCFIYSESLLKLLKLPLNYNFGISLEYPFLKLVSNGVNADLYFIAPAEAFWSHLKIALVFSALLSSPALISETWIFVEPALFPDEKKAVTPFIIFSIILFIIGLLFCFTLVLPFAINFLLTYKTKGLIPMLTLERYIDFNLKFILSFGVVFETPVIILLLVKLKILTVTMLRKGRKYAILIIFIIAAMLTPTPDMFNQCIMAIPLLALYEISIIIAGVMERKNKV